MSVTVRLMRFGKKGHPFYRIVVLDKRKKRDGAYIEKIGVYNPISSPAVFNYNKDRLSYWLEKGAQLSAGLQRLLKIKKFKTG